MSDVTIPAKFQNEDGTTNVEALAKSYTELERQRTQQQQQQVTPPAAAPAPPVAAPVDPNAGLTFDSTPAPVVPLAQTLEAAWVEASKSGGVLTPEQVRTFTAKGVEASVLESHLAGRRAMQEGARSAIFNAAGGEQQYQAMLTWGKSNLTPGEQAALNNAVKSGDASQISLAVSGAMQRYNTATGQEGQVLTGQNFAPNPSTEGYATKREWIDAMKDNRYRTNQTYRAEVQAKFEANPGVADQLNEQNWQNGQ